MKRKQHVGATRDKVLALFDRNPTATSPWIAERLGVGSAYVRATLKRNGRRLAGAYGPHNTRAART